MQTSRILKVWSPLVLDIVKSNTAVTTTPLYIEHLQPTPTQVQMCYESKPHPISSIKRLFPVAFTGDPKHCPICLKV